jgi:Protein of unknown function (DUF3489)
LLPRAESAWVRHRVGLQQYLISNLAGGASPPTPIAGPAASVGSVSSVAADPAGNVYFSAGLSCVFIRQGQELMAATEWQPHSIRGFISGTLGKKMLLAVDSAKSENGERTYSLKS